MIGGRGLDVTRGLLTRMPPIRLMAALARVDWLVYAKKPFRRVDHVLRYLGRYTHRVAISNSRLVSRVQSPFRRQNCCRREFFLSPRVSGVCSIVPANSNAASECERSSNVWRELVRRSIDS